MTEKENVFEIESSELKCSINAITTNREETERERDDVLFFFKSRHPKNSSLWTTDEKESFKNPKSTPLLRTREKAYKQT
jgi:hypothetical protein